MTPQILETAKEVTEACYYVNHLGAPDEEGHLDHLISKLQDQIAEYAAESGMDRELDYDPEAYFDSVLDKADELTNFKYCA